LKQGKIPVFNKRPEQIVILSLVVNVHFDFTVYTGTNLRQIGVHELFR
jgi:hypothetical protein